MVADKTDLEHDTYKTTIYGCFRKAAESTCRAIRFQLEVRVNRHMSDQEEKSNGTIDPFKYLG
ncbi:hypothetical protein ASC97_27060 [Rhizobium sp. Root1203]|nr:hypothetical protein ASC97_27060 [Rhizobium sp. Root1203]